MNIKRLFSIIKILGFAIIAMVVGYKIGGYILSKVVTDTIDSLFYRNLISLGQFSLSLLFGLGSLYIYKDELTQE